MFSHSSKTKVKAWKKDQYPVEQFIQADLYQQSMVHLKCSVIDCFIFASQYIYVESSNGFSKSLQHVYNLYLLISFLPNKLL